MLVLALDTALKSCSLSILDVGAEVTRVLADIHEPLEKGHAERIAPMAMEALEQAGVSVKDLDRVGVVIGPGAFAGVRVGVAFARGLALGTKLDVVGVTSLAALAGALPKREGGLIAPVIDARRGQVYAALYRDDSSVVFEPFVASPDEAFERLLKANEELQLRLRLTGDGAAFLPHNEKFSAEDAASDIDPKVVARLAAAASPPKAPPAPLYLRPPDAKPGAPSPFEGLFAETYE